MRLRAVLILVVTVALLIAGMSAPGTGNAQIKRPTPDEDCRTVAAASGATEKDLTPPRLYFLPLCDQTPVYSVDGQAFDKYCYEVKSCQADDFVQTFVNLAQVGIIALPAIALVMIIWAGFNMIMSGGNSEKINQAKKMMVGVLLGTLIIIVLAWFWATFVVFILTGDTKVFGQPWWGGEPAGDVSGATGCCTTSLGCVDALFRDQCEDKAGAQWIQGVECSTLTQCEVLQAACCIPKFIDDYGTCGIPDPLRGCADTVRYELKQESCVSSPKCEIWGCCKDSNAGIRCDTRPESSCEDGQNIEFFPNTPCADVC